MPPEQHVSRPLLLVIAVAATSFVLRLWLAHRWYGFQTGDDLEIAEEAFRHAISLVHPPWNIRSLLVPDLFVAPFVKIAWWLGIRDTLLLNDAARLPFNLMATANVFLLFRIGKNWWDERTGAVAALLYSFHWIPLLYASNTYPRTLAVTCALAAVLLLRNTGRASTAVISGLLAAVAVTTRYSEVVLAISLLIALRPDPNRRKLGLALLAGFSAGIVFFVGVYDRLTWGRWFGSLAEFATLTFVTRDASSLRVTQPVWWYLASLPHWLAVSALPLVALAVFRGERRRFFAFVFVPILLFSAIFHKELRYLQIVIPFVLLLAARGFSMLRETHRALATTLLLLSLPLGAARIGGVTKRSNNAVDAARWMVHRGIPAVAISQPWAWGGRLHLGNEIEITDIKTPPDLELVRQTAPRVRALSLHTSEINPQIIEIARAAGLRQRIDFRANAGRSVSVLYR